MIPTIRRLHHRDRRRPADRAPDVACHATIVAVLAWGLATALRAGWRARGRTRDPGPGGAVRHAER